MSSVRRDVVRKSAHHKMDRHRDSVLTCTGSDTDMSTWPPHPDTCSTTWPAHHNMSRATSSFPAEVHALLGLDSDRNINNCTESRDGSMELLDVTQSNNTQLTSMSRDKRDVGHRLSPSVITKRLTTGLPEDWDVSANAEVPNMERYDGHERKTMRRSTKDHLIIKPTYIMEPADDEKFNTCLGRRLVAYTIKHTLANYIYSPTSASVKTMLVSEQVVDNAKKYLSPRYPRYKWVCHCVMVQNSGQAMLVGDKCLWDTSCDSFASQTYYSSVKDGNYVCVAVLYGLYKE